MLPVFILMGLIMGFLYVKLAYNGQNSVARKAFVASRILILALAASHVKKERIYGRISGTPSSQFLLFLVCH